MTFYTSLLRNAPHFLHSFMFALIVLLYARPALSTGPTQIYIDQISEYSSLPRCAQDQLSTIVRAQSSGCGDNMALTSFSCFCIQSSVHMASIISSAVQTTCSMSSYSPRPTSLPTNSLMPEVASALDVFHSYCEKSTEVPDLVPTQTYRPTITLPPSTATVTATAASAPGNQGKDNTRLIVAILVPILVLLVASIAGLFLYIRRRTRVKSAPPLSEKHMHEDGPPQYRAFAGSPREMPSEHTVELAGDGRERQEMQGSGEIVNFAHELESRTPVELPSGEVLKKKERR
ncbi:uncharacterized protein BDR25DRAFT_308957 [Lindgomyces ingoldianus]|uniref:Uncharacterized protein n=1 Tax=Lindgomyces ingoldianus TaxID=673940 RepID=A0ACB6RFT6_9PLEO|nr:uncharacterized protein BDR25DRAFT_308957 [Lindgomyces ingoldianus]KAF2478153.1 hypothetical protein BDR25DRAFT_308957 [Lindgomyces ingoldianus]